MLQKGKGGYISIRSLTDETLLTTMCLVEQTLNARFITPASVDPEELEALTPNHFLLVVKKFFPHSFYSKRSGLF